jgi:hypothetical protein
MTGVICTLPTATRKIGAVRESGTAEEGNPARFAYDLQASPTTREDAQDGQARPLHEPKPQFGRQGRADRGGVAELTRRRPGSVGITRSAVPRGGFQQAIAQLVEHAATLPLGAGQASVHFGEVRLDQSVAGHDGTARMRSTTVVKRLQPSRCAASARCPARVSRYVRRRRPPCVDQSLAIRPVRSNRCNAG